jgi:hypothetical protein
MSCCNSLSSVSYLYPLMAKSFEEKNRMSQPTCTRRAVMHRREGNIGSSVDLFKFKVLLNQEMHSLLTRFCFQEFSESTIFLFDAIQDFKSEEDEDYRRQLLLDSYEEYVSRASKRSISSMDDTLYDAVSRMISLVSSGYYNREDIDPVICSLEEFLLGQLTQTYERFTSKKVDRRQSLPKIRITTNPPPLRPWGSMNKISTPTTPNTKRRRKALERARSKWVSLMRWFLRRQISM